jgi:hypothetical protein
VKTGDTVVFQSTGDWSELVVIDETLDDGQYSVRFEGGYETFVTTASRLRVLDQQDNNERNPE